VAIMPVRNTLISVLSADKGEERGQSKVGFKNVRLRDIAPIFVES
jgi:hypothetical protein